MKKDFVVALEEHYWDTEVQTHFKERGPEMRNPDMLKRLNDLGELRLKEMDEAGIDFQVLSHGAPALQRIDAETAVALGRRANDRLHQAILQHPARFAGFAVLPTSDPKAAADELERTVTKLGFKGAMVHGLTAMGGQHLFLDDKRFWPIFERAQALDVPIYMHPAVPHKAVIDAYYKDYLDQFPGLMTAGWGFGVETATQGVRLVLSGVFEAYPKLKIILGHLGEGLPFHLWRINMTLARQGNRSTPFRDTFREHFWITTSGNFSTPSLLCSVMEMGADRILFSVDYPFVPNPPGVKWMDTVPLSAEDKTKILSGTAKRLLKLSRRMTWIKSPDWDLVWILNMLWLAPVVLVLGLAHGDARGSPVDWLFFALAVPLWFGHRVSSAWLAYATPAYRPLLATQRLRFVVAPLAILALCFAVLLAPESVLPMALTERVLCLAALDYLLVSHHFAAQHYGLLCLYRERAGRTPDAMARRLDRWFALVVGGGFVVLANALAGSIAFQDRWIDPLLGEALTDAVARTLREGSVVVIVALTALMLQVELRSQRPSPPRIAYILGVSGIVLLGFLNPFLFLLLWSVQHWSAAMGLASLAASGGALATGTHWQRLLAPINRRGWAVLLVLAVLSTLLLPVLEVEAVTDEYVYADRIFGDAALWLRSSSFVPALLALGFATGFIHYVLDRAAFRFSSPEVRHAARGLLNGGPQR